MTKEEFKRRWESDENGGGITYEDIATCYDPKDKKPYVYVGDIGDNNSSHSSSFIYRFEEPEIKDTLILVHNIQKIEFVYEDGPRDAEALLQLATLQRHTERLQKRPRYTQI